jgi:hypothetical protein
VMALVRPPDAAVLADVASAYLVVTHRRSSRGSLIALGAGVAAGTLPWLIEMSVRFGGPVAAIREAFGVSHVSAIGIPARLTQYLSMADGPTLGPVKTTAVDPVAVVWLISAAALVVVGLAQRGRAVPWLAGAAALALLGEYVLLVSGLAPRFLLPGLGQLSVVAGAGVAAIWRTRVPWIRTVAIAAMVIVGIPLLGWNATVAHRVGQDVAAAAAIPWRVGLELRSASRSSPCSVISTDSYPEIGLASGCAAFDASSPGALMWLTRRAAEGDAVFLITRGGSEQLPAGWGLRLIQGIPGWNLYAIEQH